MSLKFVLSFEKEQMKYTNRFFYLFFFLNTKYKLTILCLERDPALRNVRVSDVTLSIYWSRKKILTNNRFVRTATDSQKERSDSC